MNPAWVKHLYRLPVRWATNRKLVGHNKDRTDMTRGRFTRADAKRILRQSWQTYDQLAPDLPHPGSPGARQNLALAGLTYAAVQTLTEEGVERDYAIELFGDIAYDIYIRWAAIPRFLSRLLSRNPAKRMQICCNMFLSFPFDQPGYQYERTLLDDGIAFDITHCPVAEFFRAHDAVDVCLQAWCHQDWALAAYWGGWLERTQTRVEGAAFCDFKWRAESVS